MKVSQSNKMLCLKNTCHTQPISCTGTWDMSFQDRYALVKSGVWETEVHITVPCAIDRTSWANKRWFDTVSIFYFKYVCARARVKKGYENLFVFVFLSKKWFSKLMFRLLIYDLGLEIKLGSSLVRFGVRLVLGPKVDGWTGTSSRAP